MKKLFILLLSAVALVAFASSAFALHGVKDMFEYTPSVVKSKKAMMELGGYIRVRGEAANNYTDFNDNDGTSGGDKAHWDSKIMLDFKATVSPNTMGFVQLQNNTQTSDSYTWGTCGGSVNAGVYQRSNCKPDDDLLIRQAYIATQGTELTGMLSGFKVGHMLLALGEGVFYNHTQFGDDALILWIQPNDNTEFSFIAIKAVEGSTATAGDDNDFYVLTAATQAGGFDISADLTLVDDKPTGRTATSGGTTLWNLGLRGSGDVGGGVNISADVEFQTGEIEKAAANGGDFDLGGWAAVVKASTKVGDISVRAQFGYGSGDEHDTPNEYEGFITALSQGQRYTYLYDQKATTAAQSLTNALTGAATSTQGGGNTGVANTVYVGVGASANVNPDVKVSGDLWWLKAAEKWNSASGTDDTDIGIEIDGKVTYQIDSNLVWYLEAGYLFAGDFYKNITTRGDGNPDDAYSVRHGVVLTF